MKHTEQNCLPGSLETVQHELPAWHRKQNFSDNLDHMALGVVEEVGEFAASHLQENGLCQTYDDKASIVLAMAGCIGKMAQAELKRRQGIRFSKEELFKIEADALSALMQFGQIYMTGHTEASREAMADLWKGTDVKDGPSYPEAELSTAEEAADVITFLAHYANMKGFHIGGALLSRWGKVSQRDWRRDPFNGGERQDGENFLSKLPFTDNLHDPRLTKYMEG